GVVRDAPVVLAGPPHELLVRRRAGHGLLDPVGAGQRAPRPLQLVAEILDERFPVEPHDRPPVVVAAPSSNRSGPPAKAIVAQSGTAPFRRRSIGTTMGAWRSTDWDTSRCGCPTSSSAPPTTRRWSVSGRWNATPATST